MTKNLFDDKWNTQAKAEELLDEGVSELLDRVYVASVGVFELCEHRNVIHGNGHHMAQELSAHAEKMLRERAAKIKR